MLSDWDKNLRAYLKLRSKLIAVSQREYQFKQQKANVTSRAHHYIPKHFIDGFVNDRKLLWRYNKSTDKIILNQQGSKGVFFKIDRNSVCLGDSVVPLFEHYHSTVDNLTPSALRLLRGNGPITRELAIELYDHLAILIIDLYWRNINTDDAFDKLYDSKPIIIRDAYKQLEFDEISQLKAMPETKQQIRINMAHECIRNVEQYLLNNNSVQHGMINFSTPQLCLGDMPYIMKDLPTEHLDLIRQPLFMPISSEKLYVRNLRPDFKWDVAERAMLNALIIEQSSEMVVCAEKPVLELAIKTYHIAKSQSLLTPFKAKLFGLV